MCRYSSVVVGLVLVAVAATAAPPPPKWVELGRRTVNFAVDRDVIAAADEGGTFNAVRLTARRNAIRIHRVTVHFADGSEVVRAVDRLLKPGESTHAIDLPGGQRRITKVALVYNSGRKGAKKAVVILHGRR